MIIDEEVYLAHYGKKGMRWGVRKSGSLKTKKKPLTAREKRVKNLKRKQAAGKAVSAVVTAAYVATFIGSVFSSPTTNKKYSDIKTPTSKTKSAADFVNERRDTEMYSLRRMYKEGKMDSKQFENFSKILNDRYDRKAAAAGKV